MRFLTVSLAGTAIVAGPWLLSVLGIFLIQRFAGSMISEAPVLFSGVIVYSYAFSLITASGLHYVFTRWISDLIYEERREEAGSALLTCLLVISGGAAALGLAGVIPLSLAGVVTRPLLFSLSAVLLFTAVNLTWVLMSFVSLLKAYVGILIVYLGGSLASFLGVVILGRAWAAGGALLGYALGQCLTAGVLYAMTLGAHRPRRLLFPALGAYFRRYGFLFLAGLLYAWATWADKVVFWFTFGSRVPGGWLSVYDPYDVPVFFTILTLIPSLVYFTVETETSFYPRLREFLFTLGRGTYHEIQEKKYAMIRTMWGGLREQTVVQGIASAALLILAPIVVPALFGPGVSIPAVRLTLAAVFFHAAFLSLMIFLFYFELYPAAFIAALTFFLVNLGGSAATALAGARGLAGLSYLAGGAAGTAVALAYLMTSVPRVDRILLARSALVPARDSAKGSADSAKGYGGGRARSVAGSGVPAGIGLGAGAFPAVSAGAAAPAPRAGGAAGRTAAAADPGAAGAPMVPGADSPPGAAPSAGESPGSGKRDTR
jgi:polysaccharide biosynthesis protein PelG